MNQQSRGSIMLSMVGVKLAKNTSDSPHQVKKIPPLPINVVKKCKSSSEDVPLITTYGDQQFQLVQLDSDDLTNPSSELETEISLSTISDDRNCNHQFSELDPGNLANDELLIQTADKAIFELLSIYPPEQESNLLDVQESTSEPVETFDLNEIGSNLIESNPINGEDQSESDGETDNLDDHTYTQDESNSDSEEEESQEDDIAPPCEENRTQETGEMAGGRNRKKRRHVDDTEWWKNSQKLSRQSGHQYFGKRKLEGKWDYKIEKRSKIMKNRCKCNGRTSLKCNDISNEERTKLFEKFWQLSWNEKHIYLTTLVQKSSIKRSRNRKVENESRREFSYQYHLDTLKQRRKVCKTMFCNTFGISERTVGHWLQEKGKENAMAPEIIQRNFNPRNAKINEQKQNLRQFFDSLPKLESHYCRKSTSKLYLEPNWNSKRELYRFYKSDWCSRFDLLPMSVASFLNMFDDQNIALFSPKKDECDRCVAYRTGNLSEEKYKEHQLKKKEAREEKEKDKIAENCSVYSMDLQSVLLCPKSNVSSLYYKTKLVVHNFTIFNMKTKDGFCYLWHEGNAGLSANIFASILYTFFQNHVMNGTDIEKVIMYSDGCTYQNRNALLSSALLNLSQELQVTIEQKYLEKGHTQMECDSMHSTIERKLRKKIINVPADYVEVCQSARSNPKPYIVQYLDYTFFKNFLPMQSLNSIRPGRCLGDPTVTDIRGLRYNTDGSIMFKLRHSEEWKLLPCRLNKKKIILKFEELPQLSESPIPIKREKFQHLMELKLTMNKEYHSFYDNLSHS